MKESMQHRVLHNRFYQFRELFFVQFVRFGIDGIIKYRNVTHTLSYKYNTLAFIDIKKGIYHNNRPISIMNVVNEPCST